MIKSVLSYNYGNVLNNLISLSRFRINTISTVDFRKFWDVLESEFFILLLLHRRRHVDHFNGQVQLIFYSLF